MAATNISLIKTPNVNEASEGFTLTSGTTADGFLVDFTGKDYKTVIIAANGAASAGTLTVKGGNSSRAGQDITISVPANKTVAFTLDSGYFMNVAGDDKGKVKILPSATTLTIAAVELR